MQRFTRLVIFYAVIHVLVAEQIKNETNPTNDDSGVKTGTNPIEFSTESFKKLMWKRCSNHSYVICVKLALVRAVEKLDSYHSFAILPGVSLHKRNDNGAGNGGGVNVDEEITVRNDFNEALDRYLAKKIRKYLYSLSLNVKLLDKNTIDDNMRSWSDVISHSSTDETGRGKKKYMHSLLMAGWMSGATLLALSVKTIAILSGKALIAALLSLMLSAISAFGKGGHHNAHTKSTTYEIITKPIVTHSHTSDVQEAHGSDLNPAFSYKRSIPVLPEVVIKTETVPDDIDHLIKNIRDRAPYFAPVSVEYSKS